MNNNRQPRQNHGNNRRNLENRVRRNVNSDIDRDISQYLDEHPRKQNNRQRNNRQRNDRQRNNRQRHHHKHRHNRPRHNRRNNRANSNSHTNSRANSNSRTNHADNSVHLQFLPLYVYLFFFIAGIISLYTSKFMNRIFEREWKRNNLLVILTFLVKILWAVVIYMLCAHRYQKTAWFLVFLPYIILLSLLIIGYVVIMANWRS